MEVGEWKVIINIKLVQEGGMHGIGLMNVKAVVDKYGGDFAVSCDGDKFRAVAIL